MRTAVVLVNLGGPESITDVQPFLYNLFSDSDIIKLPFGKKWQHLFARFISKMRASKSTQFYSQIGGGSPIRYNTIKQARALESVLQTEGDYRVLTAQRYWHPFISEVTEQISKDSFVQIVLLPLFPQYSNTTTLSVINEWVRHGKELPAPKIIQRFHQHPKFIQACREQIQEKLKEFKIDPQILFSAHSIPKSRVKQGDPYQQEIEETVALIMEEIHGYGYSLCYQSRLGPMKWLEPDIAAELKKLRSRGIKNILVFPLSFVSEHLETLYELDLKYKQLAQELGIDKYERADTVQDHPEFIACLKDLVLKHCN